MFSHLLRQEEVKGSICGVRISRGGPSFSHLFFADDCLIFCGASLRENRNVMRVISSYELASGQRLNRTKTSLFFSTNTSDEDQAALKNFWGTTACISQDKYLGLPTMVGRGKRHAFNSLKDKVWRRLQGWRDKFLSSAGKEILIKAVAQALPTYTMCCFQLPLGLCKDLNSLVSQFWWRSSSYAWKIHWIKWTNLCVPKVLGGLGFKDLVSFNKALLAKQGWNLISKPESLLARVLKAKYYPHGSFMNSKLGNNPSFTWRSIHGAKELLERGAVWRVGSGENVRIWKDKLLPITSTFKVMTPCNGFHEEAKVSVLIDAHSRRWNNTIVDSVFWEHEAAVIKAIPLSDSNCSDKLIWGPSKKGIFSVRSAYHLDFQDKLNRNGEWSESSSGSNVQQQWWKTLWSLKCPSKIKMFVWRLCKEALPSRVALKKGTIIDCSVCPLCGKGEESTIHAIWLCKFARSSWKDLFHDHWKDLKHSLLCSRDNLQVACSLLYADFPVELSLVWTTAWLIWTQHNAMVMQGTQPFNGSLIPKAMEWLDGWKSANIHEESTSSILRLPWSPPPEGMYKVNFNGALIMSNMRAGAGVTMRNALGEFMAGSSLPIDCVLSSDHAEACAALHGLDVALSIGLSSVVLEGDSLRIVQALNSGKEDFSVIGNIIADIRRKACCFEHFSVRHVRREANGAAHCAAKRALGLGEVEVWMEDPPLFLIDILYQDNLSLDHQ